MSVFGKIAKTAGKIATKYNPVAQTARAAVGAGTALAHGDIKGAGRAVADAYVPGPAMGALGAASHLASGDVGGAIKSGVNGYVPGAGDTAQLVGEGAAAAGGGIVSGFNALGKEYNAPYDEAAAATEKAGKDAVGLGQEQRDYYMNGLNRARGEFDDSESVYKNTVGDLSPTLYSQHMNDVMAGKNDFYDQSRKEGQRGLDSAFAARGLGNSGAALEASARMNAQLGADQARDMEGILQTGQNFDNTQKQSAFTGSMDLGKSRSDLVSGFMGKAGDSYQEGRLAGINADLAKANIGLQKRRDTLGAFSGLAGGVIGALA